MVNGLFFDNENSLDYLTASDEFLPTLRNLIPWEEFRCDLAIFYHAQGSLSRMIKKSGN